MMRDTNNVRSALMKAGGMGRGSDNQMAHVGSGEVLIPPEVIDTQPQVLPALIKAFQKAGVDWRKYIVGAPQNSKNPSTGAPEFAVGTGGMSSARDIGREVNERNRDRGISSRAGFGGPPAGWEPSPGPVGPTGFEGSPELAGRGDEITHGYDRSAQVPDFSGPGKTIGSLLGLGLGLVTKGPYGAYAGYKGGGKLGEKVGGAVSPDPYGRPSSDIGVDHSVNRGHERARPTSRAAERTSIPEAAQPGYLEFAPGMTPIQQRSMIASMGLNSDDTRFQTEETQNYYKSLLYNDLLDAGSLQGMTPIEAQYLREVLGLQWSTYDELMNLLNPRSAHVAPPRPGAMLGM